MVYSFLLLVVLACCITFYYVYIEREAPFTVPKKAVSVKIIEEKPIYSWPEETGVEKVTITYFKKISDRRQAAKVKDIIKKEDIHTLFTKLHAVSPDGGGLMVSFGPDISMTEINMFYHDGKQDHVNIMAGGLQARDTSFYTDDAVVKIANDFVVFVDSLL